MVRMITGRSQEFEMVFRNALPDGKTYYTSRIRVVAGDAIAAIAVLGREFPDATLHMMTRLDAGLPPESMLIDGPEPVDLSKQDYSDDYLPL